MNILSGELRHPRLFDDWLVADRSDNTDIWQRIAVAKSGLLVCSYSLPLAAHKSPPGQPIYIDPAEVATWLAYMAAFAWVFFAPLTQTRLGFEWSLEDLGPRARLNDKLAWERSRAPAVTLACQESVTRTAYPEVAMSHKSGMARSSIVRILGDVVRELFFPFEGEDEENNKRLCRLEPTDEQIAKHLERNRALGGFG
jgi:hypothetical protein